MRQFRKLLGFFVVCVAASSSAEPEYDYVIQMKGTKGVTFRGSYSENSYSAYRPGQTWRKSVEGVVPTTYGVNAKATSANFQKISSGGELVVEIYRGSLLLDSARTS